MKSEITHARVRRCPVLVFYGVCCACTTDGGGAERRPDILVSPAVLFSGARPVGPMTVFFLVFFVRVRACPVSFGWVQPLVLLL